MADNDKPADICQYFAMCSNKATTTVPHPRGPVPCCQSCADKYERLSAPRPN